VPQYCAWENVLSGVLSGSNNVPEAEVCALLTAVLVDVGRCWKLIASPLPLRQYNLVLAKAVNGHKTQRTAPPPSPRWVVCQLQLVIWQRNRRSALHDGNRPYRHRQTDRQTDDYLLRLIEYSEKRGTVSANNKEPVMGTSCQKVVELNYFFI